MKYRLDHKNYQDFAVYGRNQLPSRSYFIPYPDRPSADAVKAKEKRYASSKVLCLNGNWDFCFFPRPAELPEVLDTDTVAFSQIDVPSVWQLRGYDRPFYVNVRYQFPYDPPKIPTTEPVGRVFDWIGGDHGVGPRWTTPAQEYNYVGVYRRNLTLDRTVKHAVISFLGVASCLDLYVNGSWVGYSEGSHNTAEFDLTDVLRQGENELLCVVRRWCSGSYLECQDMFRHNGIFRDVLLRLDEAEDFWDIDAKTEKTAEGYRLTLTALTLQETEVRFSVEGHGVYLSHETQTKDGKAQAIFALHGVTEWNAEQPTLYNVYFETASCCVKERIGFRTVEIRGDVFTLNGQKLKLHGINHHDTSPINGFYLTPDEVERDLMLCKQFNIDTVRTSHYPPDPLLLELADELGLYIIDECDLETHGVWAHNLPPSYDRISNDPKWQPRYLDRIMRLYERDKLRAATCIILWSLGNEAGGWRNTDASYRWLKQHSALPVHYESVIHCKRQAYDVGSEMYPKLKMVAAVGTHSRRQKRLNDRPYFLCEYAHAMGVGPGNIEAYWSLIYQHDNLMGGCVWEMVDHAVLESNGDYTYGGDHGEWEHDGNFCADGIFYPDRTPSTGAWIVRHAYRPIRVRHIGGDRFEVFNTTAFSNGSRYRLKLLWNDGSEFELVPLISPMMKKTVSLPMGQPTAEGLSAIVTTTDTKTNAVVSQEQLVLQSRYPTAPEEAPLPPEFTLRDGLPFWRLPDGSVLRVGDPPTILYRAGTDNDTFLYHDTMQPYYAQTQKLQRVERLTNGFRVTTELRNQKARFCVTDTYLGTSQGVLVTSLLHRIAGGGTVPRFGKCFRLDASFDAVSYTGRAGESYCDMKEQFPIRSIRCKVQDMTEPNLRPQESGNRCDCRIAALSNGKVSVSFHAIEAPFELGIKPYTEQALLKMKHRSDEKQTGTYVTIQAFQQGIGTASCGPGIAPEFLYPSERDYVLRFFIKIEALGTEEG